LITAQFSIADAATVVVPQSTDLHTDNRKQCPVVSRMKHIIVEIQIQDCADIENHGLQPLGSLYRLGLGIWAMKP
jgi:hypothetical protein